MGEQDLVDDIAPPQRTLPQLIDALADEAPDADALVAGTTRWSYAELAERTHASARLLARLGVGPDSVVALMASNRADWVPVAVGAMRLGARLDAFNTWAKSYDLDFLLGASGASVLILADEVRGVSLLGQLRALVPEIDRPEPLRSERFPKLRHVVVMGDDVPAGTRSWDTSIIEQAPGAPVLSVAQGDAPAFVVYTSGSTNTPKAVPLCHRDLIVNGFHIGERMGLGSADRVWLGSPLFWSYGCANALMATLTHGACLVLQEHFTSPDAVKLMAAERVTAAYLLPPMIDALASTAADQIRSITSLRTGLTIGRHDMIDRVVIELDIAGICNIYGSTETYGNCCVTDHRMPLERRRSTQGRPLPGVEVRIVDEKTGEVLPVGQPGEAQVRGRVTPGYLHNDAANAVAFTADGWFRTGDRLVLDAEGSVSFLDRTGDMIKTSGINVSPAEVESFIAGYPAVRDVLVVGAPHPGLDEVAVAFVVSDDAALTAKALTAWCKQNIAGYKVPWLVVLVDELPRTGTGKFLRNGLRERASKLVAVRLAAQTAHSS